MMDRESVRLDGEGRAALDALLLLIILNFALQPLTEPDFGWHLRTGLDVLRHGWTLPATDPYSHTMPDWPWVEHAWLTDVVLGLIYSGWGGLGVILLFGCVTAGAWLLASSVASSPRFYRWLACAFSLWVALPYLGARTQLISLLGIAVLMRILSRQDRRWWWAVPGIFLLWANLHGGFTAGLSFLGIIAVATWTVQWLLGRVPALSSRLDEPILSQKDLLNLVLIMAISAAMTMVNPYGWRLYAEILDSLSNQFMLATLQEWQPISLDTIAGRSYALYLAGLAIAMLLWYRRFEPVQWAVWSFFLLLSMRHMRNIPLFLIVSLPLCAELLATAFGYVMSRVRAGRIAVKSWTSCMTVAVAVFLTWLGPDHLQHVVHSGTRTEQFFRSTSYPIEAVEWIRAHRDRLGTRLYNDYAYGGFLLWWLPDEKIFIDGRMPAWRIGDRHIFEDYMALTVQDPPVLPLLDKYSVDWALVRHLNHLDRALRQHPNWAQTYSDEKVSIYARVLSARE
ncbi:MAG TPA: hypothetical protein VIU63_07795 [Nitrospira sp.]